MAGKAVIFDELTSKLEQIVAYFARVGVQVFYSVDGKSSLEIIESEKPEMAILGVAMPGLSGIEISRRIKIDEGNRDIKIVLVSDLPGESIEARALDAGCDNYIPVDGVEEKMASIVQEVFKAPARTSLRIKVHRKVFLVCGDKKIDGTSINLSKSGMLVACDDSLDSGQQVKLIVNSSRGDIAVEGVVARILEIPFEQKTKMGLGVKFTTTSEENRSKVDELINLVRTGEEYSFTGREINLKPLIDFLLAEDAFFADFLGSLMSEESLKEPLASEGELSEYQKFDFYFPKLAAWEISAFAGGDERTDVYLGVIRKMVMLFVKFENCSRVLDHIPYCSSTDEKTLLNLLVTLLEQGQSAERQADQVINSVGEAMRSLSSQMSKTKNRYIDSKVKLLGGLVERYSEVVAKKPHLGGALAEFESMFGEMKEEYFARRKEFRRERVERREAAKDEPLPREREKVRKGSKTLAIAGGSLITVAAIVFVYNLFFAGRVDIARYSEPGVIRSARVVGGVLNMVAEDAWNSSRDKQITRETIEKIYEKLRADGVYKLKLKDSKGKLLGVVVSDSKKNYRVLVY